MARTDWPKWESGPTLEQYAQQQLEGADRSPFDGNPWGEGQPTEIGDWATRAARGIIFEFDDRGAAFNEAFHPEKVDADTRAEIIEVMAEIIRRAASRKESQP